jgi:uncharacterized delta-60 repeat protein
MRTALGTSGRLLFGMMLAVQLAARSLFAAPGDPDPTFGIDGEVTTDITTGDDTAFAVVQQPDGRLVAAGRARLGTSFDFAIARYDADGALDTTFGGTGVVTTAIENGTDIVQGVIVQPDGKLVAVGWGFIVAHWHDFAVVRYDADGSLDPTWGGTGKVTTNIGPAAKSDDAPFDLLQQADGKVVVAGETQDPTTLRTDVALVRYQPDGALDSTFGGTGVVVTPIGLGGSARAVLQQADGKLVAAGRSDASDGFHVTLVRYDLDGALDASFGGTGIVVTPIGTDQGVAAAIVQQPDGALVVAGEVDYTGIRTTDFALIRYHADGTLDPSFGGTGIVVTPIGTGSSARGLVVEGSRLVAAGSSTLAGSEMFTLARYDADGALDRTFGEDGIVTTRVNSTSGSNALTLQTDGKLVAAGGTQSGGSGCFGLVRYEGDPTEGSTTTSSSTSTSSTLTTSSTTSTSTTETTSSTVTTTTASTSTSTTSSTTTSSTSTSIGTSSTTTSAPSSTVTSTTTGPGSTTSTTLGCAADRLTCICRAGLGAPACADERVPRGVRRRFAKACRAVAELATGSPKRRQKLHRTAERNLEKARALATRAGRGRISGDCARAIVDRLS